MKIAVIGAKGLPARQGGIEHLCQELYPRMADQGHQIDFYGRCSYTHKPWFHRHTSQGIRVISLPSLKVRGCDAFLSAGMGALATLPQPYDIIHFHALGPSLFSVLPKLTHQSKVVVTCHGLDWSRAKWDRFSSWLIRLGEKTAVRYADGLIVVSNALRDYFHKTYERDTVYIPTAPVPYAPSDPKFNYVRSLGLQPKKYLLFLGRLVPEKCPDLLIRAFQALNPPGWKLVLVGGTSDTNRYASEILDLAQGNSNIVFAGELHGASLAEVVRGAGLFVLPSEVEGLPMALLEAMQENVPVLASNIQPHQQLIAPGDRGLLFQTGNLQDFTHWLNWALSHPEQMQRMATQAYRHVQLHHNWEVITRDTLRLYETLISRDRQPLPTLPPAQVPAVLLETTPTRKP